ncbi:protein phosphatase 1 regulatory subunit 15B [Nerophis lumbriciformis]|uniref:protein phosphatase 1 regulatory subunit 15B n=1 Tax=Nerophis lumbriciformis TaxID=546530 RepID=UPI003BAC096C
MFGNRSTEGQLPCGKSLPSSAGLTVASPGLDSQESSWIGLFSVWSRPAMSFLHKYMPGLARTPFLADGGDMNNSLVNEQGEFLRHLDVMMPLSQNAACPAGLQEPRTDTTLSWLSTDSLQEVGIQSEASYWSSSWPSQDMQPGAGTDCMRSKSWLSSFFGGDVAHTVLLASNNRTMLDTKESHGVLSLSEHAGLYGEEAANNDRNCTAAGHQVNIGAACSAVSLLTRDQDNGYSSLEEEQAHICHLLTTQAPAGPSDTTEEAESEGRETQGENEESATAVASPHCQNKSIAFIMGCPCSDDDDDDSSSQSEDDDDDDGFDSEGSSFFSDTTDEDDEASDSDGPLDPEAERLLTSLCPNRDPYNLRNFTAALHTGSTPARSIPVTSPPSSTQSTPASSPDVSPLAILPLTSSPPSGQDTWDDSTSASEVDEAESLRLLSSFASSDPYSLFNFQAPLGRPASAQVASPARTPPKAPSRPPRSKAPLRSAYRKKDVEKTDRSVSELSTCSVSSLRTSKKVRFSDRVEEFFANCGEEEEDRKGPWEELARDRCRFLRRCQEVELSIAYCLQPQHRRLVYRRLTAQDA